MAAVTRAPAAPTTCPSGQRPDGSIMAELPQAMQWAKGTGFSSIGRSTVLGARLGARLGAAGHG
jgi:hypothetical protein